MRSVRLVVLLLVQQLKARLEYRRDVWLQLLTISLHLVVNLVFVWSLFVRVPTIAGWGFWEVAFLYGLMTVVMGTTQLTCEGAWQLPSLIRKGELDRLLIRPLHPALHVLTLDVSLPGLGSLVLGLLVMLSAARELPLNWQPWMLLYLLVVVVSGTVIMASLNLAAASFSFWSDDLGTSVPFMVNRLGELARFPLTIYPKVLSGLLMWVLPFAFIGFVPLSFLLEEKHWIVALGAPLAAAVVGVVAQLIFRAGLRRYESVGH
jgi:ABC-2 type transport system permease protein